jgi:hypothetical protein
MKKNETEAYQTSAWLMDAYFKTTDPFMRDTLKGKIVRAMKWEQFWDKVVPILLNHVHSSNVQHDAKMGRIIFLTREHGKLVYFPKADRLLIAKDGIWHPGSGRKWLQKNVDSTIPNYEWIEIEDIVFWEAMNRGVGLEYYTQQEIDSRTKIASV